MYKELLRIAPVNLPVFCLYQLPGIFIAPCQRNQRQKKPLSKTIQLREVIDETCTSLHQALCEYERGDADETAVLFRAKEAQSRIGRLISQMMGAKKIKAAGGTI